MFSKDNILSGFLVFLIALPLSLGIASASGFPPITGIYTAIIGGCVAVFFGSSKYTIKGPAAGLIVIVLGAVLELGHGDMILGYKRCLAVGLIAGGIQVIISLLRWGKFAGMIPPSVIQGMLSSIGIIIVSKQIHVLFGYSPEAKTTIGLITEIPKSIIHLNPIIFFIGTFSLAIVFLWPFLNKFSFSKIPAPLLIVLLSIPLVLHFDIKTDHQYLFMGKSYDLGSGYLVELPSNILSAITVPDFSAITSITSLKYIIMFALVGMIESLLTVSAVDTLTGENSDLDKDLLSVGICNSISACIGGLPMISEIVRSKANIDNGATGKWANFYHGLSLLVFVSLFPKFIGMIPLAVLAAMLVFTGLRLASPANIRSVYRSGKDQFLLFLVTLIATILTDLLIGVFAGVLAKIVLHLYHGVTVKDFFKISYEEADHSSSEEAVKLNFSSPLIFLNCHSFIKIIKSQALKNKQKKILLDLDNCRVIDSLVLTEIDKLKRQFRNVEALEVSEVAVF